MYIYICYYIFQCKKAHFLPINKENYASAAPGRHSSTCMNVSRRSNFRCDKDLLYTPISKHVVGQNGEWQLSNGNCTTERNCGFHIWYAKTISSSRGDKVILPHERPTGCVSQTPKKNEASATEFWRIWANHMTRHRRSALYGARIMEDYFRLLVKSN